MALIDPSRILNNIVALGVILGIGFLIYSQMDKQKIQSTLEGIKGMFNRGEGK